MTLEHFISQYGYLALFLGILLEGEMVLIIAGIAARQEFLSLFNVIMVAYMGAFLSDQFFFFLGRLKGNSLIVNRPAWRWRARKVQRMLKKYQNWAILGFRFFYGTRIIAPFVIGTSKVTVRRFVILNVICVGVWASIIASGGYLFGHAVETLFKDVQHYQKYAILGFVLLGFILWLIQSIRTKRIQKNNRISETDDI
ncbi:DedA family protein [candidate division KSB1 bacterium]|nr:DedA family protein [candidate division KSB1 bacterium]